MKKNLEPSSCIKTVPIFKNLSEEELEEIIMISSHKKFDKGDFIYQSGETIESLYVVHQGKVKVTRYSDEGKEQIIRILSHGDFLGELALFNGALVSTYAEVMEPSVICFVQNQRLKKLLEKSPTLGMKMMSELSNRLDRAESLIEQSNLYSAEAKMARLFLDLESHDMVFFTTTKINLSLQLGITPETFSRKLKKFELMGYIRIINNKTIKILSKTKLRRLFDSSMINNR
jgi:CRP/FNR family transcriptional regulator